MIDGLETQCPAGAHFVYPEKTCLRPLSGYPGCHGTVKKLYELKVDNNDSTKIFVENQTCIAERACTYRESLDSAG